jgi:catechol 2,3-dioxygenase-like lactoylglutathione lyase family enzyme
MDWKLELISVPVSDVDRAKAFYSEQVGFNLDHDHQVTDELRFVQLTPPGSACSIIELASARTSFSLVSRSRLMPRPSRHPHRRTAAC